MSRAVYNQLQRRCPLANTDGSLQGRPWGIVIDQKCCHSYRAQPHWHVVHEYNRELFVWIVPKRIEDAKYHFQGKLFEPRADIGTDFLDACMLETHLGCPEFFKGRVFDLVRDEEVRTTIEFPVEFFCSGSSATWL
ncbi:hypothetical protein ACFVFS_23940 [Kitasatospora sp. NPDC057692]|uniref:hypothetical protein n=1 Tax=Kitasatospora sp. NPDC057692 TaxID=3346215 RepID=UPI0036A83737